MGRRRRRSGRLRVTTTPAPSYVRNLVLSRTERATQTLGSIQEPRCGPLHRLSTTAQPSFGTRGRSADAALVRTSPRSRQYIINGARRYAAADVRGFAGFVQADSCECGRVLEDAMRAGRAAATAADRPAGTTATPQSRLSAFCD